MASHFIYAAVFLDCRAAEPMANPWTAFEGMEVEQLGGPQFGPGSKVFITCASSACICVPSMCLAESINQSIFICAGGNLVLTPAAHKPVLKVLIEVTCILKISNKVYTLLPPP